MWVEMLYGTDVRGVILILDEDECVSEELIKDWGVGLIEDVDEARQKTHRPR